MHVLVKDGIVVRHSLRQSMVIRLESAHRTALG